jgi:hypothetical protein
MALSLRIWKKPSSRSISWRALSTAESQPVIRDRPGCGVPELRDILDGDAERFVPGEQRFEGANRHGVHRVRGLNGSQQDIRID